MSTGPIYVQAAGLACPIGLTWAASCAALRCGISRKFVSPYLDNQGREVVASYLQDGIGEDVSTEDRWLYLLAGALTEIAQKIGRVAFQQMPLLFALPASIESRAYASSFLAYELGERLGLRLDTQRLHLFNGGAYGSYRGLQYGRELAQKGQPCVVAAAESMLCAATLLRLSDEQRLLVEGNADGITPGEAAAALVLSRERWQALACMRGLGFAQEDSLLHNAVPLRADGIVAATRAALQEAELELHDIDFRVSDASGESFYFKEQALLVARLLRTRKAALPLWLAAESLGATGAAAGLCGILWAIAAWARGYAPGPRVLGFAGNDQGERAAVVMESIR